MYRPYITCSENTKNNTTKHKIVCMSNPYTSPSILQDIPVLDNSAFSGGQLGATFLKKSHLYGRYRHINNTPTNVAYVMSVVNPSL